MFFVTQTQLLNENGRRLSIILQARLTFVLILALVVTSDARADRLSAYREVLRGLAMVQIGDCDAGWKILWSQTRSGSPEASIALLTSISLTMQPPFRSGEQESLSKLTSFLAVESIPVNGEIGGEKLSDLELAYEIRQQYLKAMWPENDAAFFECTGVQVTPNCYSQAKKLSLSPPLEQIQALIDESTAHGNIAICETRE